jgi:uncharacterized protein (UPF0262 family)
MPPPSKRLKAYQDNAVAMTRQKLLRNNCIKAWQSNLNKFEEYDLKNPRGRSRTADENKLILLSIRLLFNLYLEQAKANIISIHTISWHLIEKVVAENFFITQRYVNTLRKSLFEDGELVVFGGKTGNIDSPTKENDDDDAFDDEEEGGDDTED